MSEELSTLGITVLIAGIAVFIIILTIFIVWKVKCENAPAPPRRPSPSDGPAMSRSPRDTSMPVLTATAPQDFGASPGSTTGHQYSNLDSSGNNNIDGNKPGGEGYHNVPNGEDANSAPAMTTFGSSNIATRSAVPPGQGTAIATSPPQHKDGFSPSYPAVAVVSGTQPDVYSYLGENKETTDNEELSTDEYDNSAIVKDPQFPHPVPSSVPHEPGGSFVSHPQGSNSSQEQNPTGVYSLASAIVVTEDNERRSEESGGIQPGSGDYFELEPMNRSNSESSAADNYFVLERQEVEGQTETASTDNVYVQLEDEHLK